jgi:hypothetical protein
MSYTEAGLPPSEAGLIPVSPHVTKIYVVSLCVA